MKGKIWVSTYRRSEMLQEYLHSISVTDRVPQIVVVHPKDEHPELPIGISRAVASDDYAHSGPGAIRHWIVMQAIKDRDDFAILSDDDVTFHPDSDFSMFAENFEKDSNVGIVTASGGKFGGTIHHHYSVGVLFGIRLSVIREVGNFDLLMSINEDTDLAMRYTLAGYDVMKDRKVAYRHHMHREGGLAAYEKTIGNSVKTIRMKGRMESCQQMIDKYPGLFTIHTDKGGYVGQSLIKKSVKRFIDLYNSGHVGISVLGVEPKDWQSIEG